MQDCVCLIAPYPNNPNPPETFDVASDFDMSGSNLLWYGRLQLLFRCTLRHRAAAIGDVARHLEVTLAFFSTFEPVDLTPDSIMQQEGVPMLFDSASCAALPSLYLCHAKNVLGRVPMIPSFVAGNAHPTIPHSLRGRRLGGGMADKQPNRGNGSRLYEVNLWMWRYGRGQERKLSVRKCMEARVKRLREARGRAAETRKRRRLAAEGAGREGGAGAASP